METLWAGYGFVWRQRRDFVAYAFVPFVLAALNSLFVSTTGIGQFEIFNPLSGFNAEGPSHFYTFPLFINGGPVAIVVGTIATLFQFGFYIGFSVAWYRRYLTEQSSNPLTAVFEWRRRQFRYSFYFVVVNVLHMITFAILVLVLILIYIGGLWISAFLARANEGGNLSDFIDTAKLSENPVAYF